MLPAVERTYAPIGQTPLLTEQATRKHLSVIGAVTPVGQLLTSRQAETLRGVDAVRFLQHLERQLGGKLLVYWDGGSIHHGEALQEWLAAHPGVEIERLPAYAPELNPVEGVWNELKRKDLANASCLDLPELRRLARRGTQRLQRRPDLIRGFFAEAGYH